MVRVELAPIPDGSRLADDEVVARGRAARAAALGALLDVVAAVVLQLPDVQLSQLPRMADYARILRAVDKVLGTDGLSTYLATRGALARDAVDGDPVAAAVRDWASALNAPWRGPGGAPLHPLPVNRPAQTVPPKPPVPARHLTRTAPAVPAARADPAQA